MRKLFNAIAMILLDTLFPKSRDERLIERISSKTLSEKLYVRQVFDGELLYALFYYSDPETREMLRAFKYRNKQVVAHLLSSVVFETTIDLISDLVLFENFTDPIVVPIPLSKKRLRERGYNQSELIARAVEKLDIDCVFNYEYRTLSRTVGSESQVRVRDRKARMKNVLGAFEVHNQNAVKGRNIILLDDVITTGSTMREAKRVLLECGAQSVIGIGMAH